MIFSFILRNMSSMKSEKPVTMFEGLPRMQCALCDALHIVVFKGKAISMVHCL